MSVTMGNMSFSSKSNGGNSSPAAGSTVSTESATPAIKPVVSTVPSSDTENTSIFAPVHKPEPQGLMFFSTRGVNSGSKNTKKPKGKRKFAWVAYAGAFIAIVLGVLLVWKGMQPVYQDAPLPEETMVVAPEDQEPIGPDGVEAVVTNNTNYPQMSVSDMANGSIFIPAIGAYSLIDPSEEFESSGYVGFYSIEIPADAQRSFWYSAGAPLVGGREGTTVTGGHYGYYGNPGALQDLYTLSGGEIIWTKDFDGNIQKWQTTEMFYLPHTEFPQEFWDTTGVRRLIVTTCGGTASSNGTFSNNVFASAKPIPSEFDDAVSKTAFEPEKPEEGAQLGAVDGPQSGEQAPNIIDVPNEGGE